MTFSEKMFTFEILIDEMIGLQKKRKMARRQFQWGGKLPFTENKFQ